MTKLLCLLFLRSLCAMGQTVEGSVFDAATGAGVGGVKVELLRGATPFYDTVTDGGGRFRLDNVKEADYAARYQSPDYWLTAGPSDYRTFHVATGDPVKLEARLMPWSKISGRVVDGRGKAIAKAQLELSGSGMVVNGRTYLRTSWGGGGGGQLNERPLQMSFRGNTGADGRFEVQVMPGTYGLSVVPPPELKPPDPEPDGPVLAWKTTYYPRAAFPDEASKLVVLPGSGTLDVELKLLAVPAHAVRGVVLNPDGTPASKLKILLGEAFGSANSVESKPDGTFEFPAVAEGEWRFSAEAQRGGVKLRALEWIEVARHDLENVKLRLVPPLTIRGKVVTDAPKDAAAPKLGPLLLSLVGGRTHRLDLGLFGGAFIALDAKGDLMVAEAYPGVYRLATQLQPPPAPYYLDSVRIGDADLVMREVDVSFDTTLTVVYKTNGGLVRGTAENCASGGVVLVPIDPALQGRGFSKSAPCDARNHYEVLALRPGDYYALAFAGNGPVPELDEAVLKQGVKVTVRAGEASSADLRTITKPVY